MKDFMACFNREKVMVDDPDEKVVLPALLGGIWHHSLFMAKLAQRTPTNISDFVTKEEQFINADESIKAFVEQGDRTNRLDQKSRDQQ